MEFLQKTALSEVSVGWRSDEHFSDWLSVIPGVTQPRPKSYCASMVCFLEQRAERPSSTAPTNPTELWTAIRQYLASCDESVRAGIFSRNILRRLLGIINSRIFQSTLRSERDMQSRYGI
ncbi:hypothetical protein TNCV_1410471 [Trichonephila clavipes]|nr:hypothetical protein TNCV_1410471 [Trichonephila clavipes]